MANASPTVLVYPGEEMTAQDFAMLIERVTPEVSGVLYGCTPTRQDSSTLHISAGWAVVRGRLVKITAGNIAVTLPSSGSGTRYIVLKVDLANDVTPTEIDIETYVPSDLPDFNVDALQAYLSLGSFTVSTSGISGIVASRKMSVGIETVYKTRVDYTYNNQSWWIELRRYGRVVCARMVSVGATPANAVGTSIVLGEGLIPTGYRPNQAVYAPWLQVVSNNMSGSGRGEYVIRSTGKVEMLTNTEKHIERITNVTWITDDPVPS